MLVLWLNSQRATSAFYVETQPDSKLYTIVLDSRPAASAECDY